MATEFIINGVGTGYVAQALLKSGFNANVLRPYIGEDGRNYVTLFNALGEPMEVVTNAPATLRKDEWIYVDEQVIRAAKPRLRLIGDLRASGLSLTIPNGMSKTMIQHATATDISPATISMDALRYSERDRPEYDLVNLPLPIIHKDFSFPAREIMVSRNGSTPLDTTTGELASRRVAEEAEKLALGVSASYSYGGGTIYGLTNFPSRNTKTMTAFASTTGATFVGDILAMKSQSQADGYYGPWMLYTSPSFDAVLDADYSATKGDNTLRQRVLMIDGIEGIMTLDYLTGNQVLLVQMTNDVIQIVVGMDVTTIQWESHGGMQINYKVMAIMVPRLRADSGGNTGIVHGVAS